MSAILIKNGTIIDPANGINEIGDMLLDKGKIVKIAKNIDIPAKKVIDAKGKWVTPGLIDIHTHLREPGFEYKETIESGAKAAAAGGFTSIACMANTDPVNDCASVTGYILERAKSAPVNIYPVGAVTEGLKGKALANIGELAEAGVVALSDDGKCVVDGEIMRNAMDYASMFSLTILEHAEDVHLACEGSMNEGIVSNELGIPGQPVTAEDVIVARDISLSEYLDIPIHFCHVSCASSVELIRHAKSRGARVTAEAAPHHFTLTDKACRGYDTNAKMAPPLRTEKDRMAIRRGLKDGTINCIATDHAPHSEIEKELEFECAAFGIVGLETAVALSLALVHEGVLAASELVDSMTRKPAEVIGLDRGTLGTGKPADVTIIDPDVEWKIEPDRFKSKSRNTPFAGWNVRGRAVTTITNGKVVYAWDKK